MRLRGEVGVNVSIDGLWLCVLNFSLALRLGTPVLFVVLFLNPLSQLWAEREEEKTGLKT